METFLIEDTLAFLRLVLSDRETSEIVRSTAHSLLNSWEHQKSKSNGEVK